MKAGLLRLADYLGSSYWFVPTIMAIGAVLLATGVVTLDAAPGSSWMGGYAWIYALHPDGARQALSSVGGSMITVAGTVFSLTVAAVVYAAGQSGPRLLTNFMRDRGDLVTLGTFIATFLYCLLVLRTIRSAEESGGYGFVPNLALLVGVLLALCSIAVLIYFIHRVPSTIHINSVIEDVGDRPMRGIDDRFPNLIGTAPDDHASTVENLPATFRDDADAAVGADRFVVKAKGTGYIQFLDDETVMRLAGDNGLILRLRSQPGDFVHVGRALVEAWLRGRCDEGCADAFREEVSIGSRRSALQDLRFLIDKIAARALVQYCAPDMVAALRYLNALGEVSLDCDEPERLATMRFYADRLEELANEGFTGFNLRRVRDRAEELRTARAEPDYKRRLRDCTAWLAGTA